MAVKPVDFVRGPVSARVISRGAVNEHGFP